MVNIYVPPDTFSKESTRNPKTDRFPDGVRLNGFQLTNNQKDLLTDEFTKLLATNILMVFHSEDSNRPMLKLMFL